jgi:hypothetical protein
MTYLRRIPKVIPDGMVVVHNNVRPTRRLSSRGFRAWLEPRHAALMVCACGWAPELVEHYIVDPNPAA